MTKKARWTDAEKSEQKAFSGVAGLHVQSQLHRMYLYPYRKWKCPDKQRVELSKLGATVIICMGHMIEMENIHKPLFKKIRASQNPKYPDQSKALLPVRGNSLTVESRENYTILETTLHTLLQNMSVHGKALRSNCKHLFTYTKQCSRSFASNQQIP